MGWTQAFVFWFGGGERFRNETQSVEPIEPAEVRVVAGTCRRGDEGAKKGRIVVGWARPDSNRRSSLCESDVLTAGLRARLRESGGRINSNGGSPLGTK
jgi:hypothetical protein